MLRLVRCLVRCGATTDEAAAVVFGDLKWLRTAATKKQRRWLALVSMRLVPVSV
jgi:hypothetical protein